MHDNATELSPRMPESRDGNASLTQKLLPLMIVLPILLAAAAIGRLPYTLTEFRQFENYANGKRVQFIGTYIGGAAERAKVVFDGETLFAVLQNRRSDVSLKIGENYWVNGTLQRPNQPATLVTITQADFRPTTDR